MTGSLRPQNQVEKVALFRAQVLGPVLNRELHHGELMAELRKLSERVFRPPGSPRTRRYALETLLRWHRAYKAHGLDGLKPKPRAQGNALALTDTERDLLLEIRREHPHASATVILATLEDEGRLERGKVSANTVRRLYRAHGLKRGRRRDVVDQSGERRRWEAAHVGALWHGDVCHGPTLSLGNKRIPMRIHALMDDKSRYVVALRVLNHEREVGMLDLLVEAARIHGLPEVLYLDNGSTYSGDALATACGRLDVNLVHATPYNPKARGKMERFWRTMRDGCLDLLGPVKSLHDVQVRLTAWLTQRYHKRPHASLVGRSPAQLWAERRVRQRSEDDLAEALTVRERRRVRGDATIPVGGVDWELRDSFLVGKNVDVARTLADRNRAPWVEHEGQRYALTLVDPVANGKLRKKKRARKPGIDAVDFDPTRVLLEQAIGRRHRGGSK